MGILFINLSKTLFPFKLLIGFHHWKELTLWWKENLPLIYRRQIPLSDVQLHLESSPVQISDEKELTGMNHSVVVIAGGRGVGGGGGGYGGIGSDGNKQTNK